MKYLSVCSGIEAATQAWHPLGWEPWAFSQFDPEHNYKSGPDFPSAVLKVHYPNVPNLGDMTKFKDWPDAVFDVLVGGTPCQSYSVAGLRAGLDDPRGDLMLTYVAIARRYRPSWVVWENVPGVLSDDGGRSFGTLLGLLTGKIVEVPSGGWETAGFIEGYKSAYGIAWRVVDSQFVRVDGFGRAVPQRRRRVFVVGYLGDWRRAAAVLFERESMSGDPAPRRRTGQGASVDVAPSLVSSGRGVGRTGETRGQDSVIAIPEVANPLTARMHKGVNTTMDEGQTMIAAPFAFKASYFTREKDGAPSDVFPPLSADADKGDQDPLICAPIPFDTTQLTNPNNRSNPAPGDPCHPLAAGAHAPAIAFDCKASGRNGFGIGEVSPTLRAMGGGPDTHKNGGGPPPITEEVCGTLETVKPWNVAAAWRVRRLTPVECERLQGMADGYTNIPWRGKNGAPDGQRYRALGNSMSVNVMRWIGRRIEMVEKIFSKAA
jgi:DNA (cytosine-5)-methyltransferase 1